MGSLIGMVKQLILPKEFLSVFNKTDDDNDCRPGHPYKKQDVKDMHTK